MSIRKDANGKPTRLYGIWKKVRQRCNSSDNPAYHNYGGRGIYMTSEWNDFENFYEWAMANGYQDDLSVDRIDNDGPYSPENCRWATRLEQANNTRSNIRLEWNGVTYSSFCALSRAVGIPQSTLRNRLFKLGWTMEEACKREARPLPRGPDHPRYGVPFTEEHKANIRAHHRSLKGKDNPTSKPVQCIETGRVFDCQREAADWAGVAPSRITRCLQYPSRSINGYHWRTI